MYGRSLELEYVCMHVCVQYLYTHDGVGVENNDERENKTQKVLRCGV